MQEEPSRRDEAFVEDSPPNWGQRAIMALLCIGLSAMLIYAYMEHRSAKQLAANLNTLSAAFNREHAQVETLTQKLMAAESAAVPAPLPAPSPAPAPSLQPAAEGQVPAAILKPVRRHFTRHITAAKARPAEDRWRKQIQSEIAAQQKLIADHQRQIQETKESVDRTRTEFEGNLQSTRDDLNGSIAKNHEELVALERKGERNYYEFDLQKSKHFQKTGPISISLHKSNVRHEYCDLAIIVNDSQVGKNHVNLYEPVLFYPEGFSQPLQVVINSITKDAARGYVSEPKYRYPPELAASKSDAGGKAASSGEDLPSSPSDSATLKHRPVAQ